MSDAAADSLGTDSVRTWEATPGAKMMYLIRRKPTASREELVAHWFANHMPQVVQSQHDQAAAGRVHASRYIATLFDVVRDADGRSHRPWDGVAQLWFDRALPMPSEPHGATPTDTFQQNAQPYVPWATTEYVVIDGSERLPVEPLTLNAPFPCTRSGFFKVTFLVKAKAEADVDALFSHWLSVHAPNVTATMNAVGGFRYVISLSIDPSVEPYAGMAELYFADASGWAGYRKTIQQDGMAEWVTNEGTLVLQARTEMIGIP
jgi:hypothetical protein